MIKKPDAYRDLLARLRAAFPDPAAVGDDYPSAVVEAVRGCGSGAWQEFDERGGYRDAGADVFSLVRQVRNSPVYGRRLFAAINETED